MTEQSIPGETLTAQVDIGKKDYFVLLRNDEEVQTEFKIPDSLSAPVRKGSVVGTVVYSIGEEKIGEFNITATETVEKRSMRWSVGYIWKQYFLNEHRKIKINQYK